MRRLLGIIALSLLTAIQISAADQPALRRFALLIGSNDGGRERQHLLYAEKDARTLADVLTEVGGVAPFDTTILTDPRPDEVNRAFAGLKTEVDAAKIGAKRIEFILYYSGHSDETGLLLGDEIYEYSDLRRSIDSIRADVHIAILDSCSSGSFTRLKGGTRRSPFLVDESVETSGHAFLTSSSENEAAQESDAIGGSFFTHYLISGLRGAADASQDSKVTLNEAYSYASNETLARTENSQAGPQHPSYDIKLTGSGDLILTDLRSTDASMQLAPDISGRVFIRDEAGHLIAEMRKLEGIPLALALPAGLYSATLQTQQELYESDLILRAGRPAYLQQSDFQILQREKTRSRGAEEYPYYRPGLPEEHEGGIVSEVRNDVYASLNWELEQDPSRLRHVDNYFGFITPPDMARDTVIHNFGLYLVGTSYRLEGFGLGLANMQVQDMAGFQYGGLFTITGGNTIGFAGAGIFTITGGNISGGVGSGGFNIAGGDVSFLQGAGIFNAVEGDLTGFQGAGIFNAVQDGVSGAQTAGIFNVNGGDLAGVQAAGIMNVNSGKTDGAQLSAILNVAEETHGLQAGMLNIAEDISGVQVGLINISQHMDGIGIGLINISGNGLHNFSGWMDSSDYYYLGYQLGAGASYTLAYAGAPTDGGYERALVSGLGYGFHIPFWGAFYSDIDLSAKMVVPGNSTEERFSNFYAYEEEETIFPSLRATVGLNLFGDIAIFVGLTLEGHIPGVTNKSETFHTGRRETLPVGDSSYDLELYPKTYFGIRL